MPGVVKPSTPPEEAPSTIDELIRQRAFADPDVPLIAYPSEGSQYVDYTARQLDVFAHRVAQQYARLITPRSSSADKIKVVGILAPSNFEYLVSTLALTKLGMTVLFLSTRISDAAYINLLKSTECNDILIDPTLQSKALSIQKELPLLNIQTVASSRSFEFPLKDEVLDTAMDHMFDHSVENMNIAWIIHSSRSTGLPKPIFQTHAAALRNYANNFDMRGLITLPMYHAHELSSVFRAIHSKKQIHIYSASLPLTGPTLVETILKYDFEIFYGVPYALKLLIETETGLTLLSKLKLVMFGCSSCPQELGDKLVNNGVKLVGHYGTTETGQLMTSFRGDDELDWNYLRVSKSLQPFIRWEERGADHYELVVLEGWPSKVATNRPDGAYATKDLFVRHPTKSHCFKWTGRLDDTLVLLNGEKANPILIEHTVRQNHNVAEAVVFGAGKPQLGLFIIPSANEANNTLSEQDIISSAMTEVEAANADIPAYAQISPDMIRVLSAGIKYPRTDKDTVIRAAFYTQFKDEIEKVYEDLSAAATGGRDMDNTELKELLRNTLLDLLKLDDQSLLSDDTDFFSLGLDSLQALRTHSAIIKNFNTNGHAVGQNVVFEHPSLDLLAQFVIGLSKGEDVKEDGHIQVMDRLLSKYSTFRAHIPGTSSSPPAVMITGATGSLGAHMVAELVQRDDISKVYCLVRAESHSKAKARVITSLIQRKLYHTLTPTQRHKIVSLPSNLGRPDFGLDTSTRDQLLSSVGTVIHLAWAVNFNWGIESFEPQHIAGTHHLLQFCLDSTRPLPAAFHFGSSVSAVAEAIDSDFAHAQGMGYARSKLVTENMCARAAAQHPGLVARVLRIGQVVGDTRHGIWNATEAIPLMIQSALTVGALPALDESPTWLPVDTVAQSIADIAFFPTANDGGAVSRDAVFHIVNPAIFHWTRDLLPALRAAGLEFEEVEQREWIRRLRASNPDPVANPPFKLLDFFASKYDREGNRPGLYFATDRAKEYSPALHAAGKLEGRLVGRCVEYWKERFWGVERVVEDVTRMFVVCGGGSEDAATALSHAISKQLSLPLVEEGSLSAEKLKRKALGAVVDKNGVVVLRSSLQDVDEKQTLLADIPSDVRVVDLALSKEGDELLLEVGSISMSLDLSGIVEEDAQVVVDVVSTLEL